jgi:folylpolyglutamate synthase/dihydropteroate synthase
VILTASASPRAAAPADLRALVPASLPSEVARSVAEALALAEAVPAAALVCVAGSLTLVGAALEKLDGGDEPCLVENAADSIGPL